MGVTRLACACRPVAPGKAAVLFAGGLEQPLSGSGGANTRSGGRMITGIGATALGMDLQEPEAFEQFLASLDSLNPLLCPGALEEALRDGGGKLLPLPDDEDKLEFSGEPREAEADQPVGLETRKQSATITELLLEELKRAQKTALGAAAENEAERIRPVWPQVQERAVDSGAFFPARVFVGQWVHSYGNRINVDHDNAFLTVVVMRFRRRDLHLKMRPVAYGAGWQCGHSI